MSQPALVHYEVDDTAAIGQWTARSRFDFSATVTHVREAIAARRLWVIHEIDPQMLLHRVGLTIHATRQVQFFHPRYMRQLLSVDARAIVEAPLKIVIMAAADNAVVLRGPDIAIALARYQGLDHLAEELAQTVREIVATVAT